MADVKARPSIAKCGLARAMVVVFVCVTAAVSLAWSHAKLLSQDEMYEFQTDSVRSLAELVHVQRTWPISLDPLLYHALSHGAMQAFGAGASAQRLPALAGFLLMQVCLFFFVRNLVGGSAGERAGAVAAAFPAVTATLFYAVEGRPYGLMLGLYALALWCWQVASRSERARAWALVGLAAALAGTINAHYFGILLLVPVCAAEAWRTLARRPPVQRKIDWAMCAAIAAGMAGFLATRPFLEAAGEFRKNYYNGGWVGRHDITRAYRAIFVNYTQMAMSAQHMWMVALVVFAAALVWGCWRVRRGIETAEWVLVLALAALPFCGYLLARFVTHSIEVRYVLGALVAISAMLAIAVSEWLKRDAVFHFALVLLGLGIVCGGAVRIHAEQRKTSARLASLVLPAEVKAALLASADGRLYVQDMGAFEEDRYYEPDADVQARMTLVYSADEELRWNKHDTMALTAMHMQHFAGLPVMSYEALRAQPGEHVFVLFHTGWDWTDQAFAQDGASVRPVGKAMGGDVAAVRFR
jgi:4-amino-4-deoxy-L-arabinose transferase-like glycosyltransferase